MDKEDYQYRAVVKMLMPEERDLPIKIIYEITEMYFNKYTAIPFDEYTRTCVRVKPKDSFKDNTKYNITVRKLCKSGKAKYVEFDDMIVFLNWNVCYSELLRNFSITW